MCRVLGLEAPVQWEPKEGKEKAWGGSTRVAHEGRKERGENEEEGEEGRMEEVHTERHREREKERGRETQRQRGIKRGGRRREKEKRRGERFGNGSRPSKAGEGIFVWG